MDWMMMMLLMGNGRQLDRERLRTWAMNDRKEKMETYAKISRGLAFGAYYVYSSLKLKVKTAAGEVDATDSTVSSTAKQNATLAGIQELYRAMPWFALVNEAATFVGETVAKATSLDPIMLELFSSSQPPAGAPTSIQVGAPPIQQAPVFGAATGRTIRVSAPNGQMVPLRLNANGITVEDPNWTVSVD